MQAPGYLKLDYEPISNSPTKVRYTEHFPIVSEYITQQNEAIHENDVQGISCISIDFVPRYKFADTYLEQTVCTSSCTLHSNPSPSTKYTISVRQSLLEMAQLFSLKFNRLVFLYMITNLNRCYYYAKYLVSNIFCLLSLAQMSFTQQSIFMRQPRYQCFQIKVC